MARNKQLDKGAGRQIWKCHDLLNGVASFVFRKHGTWVQTWTWNFRGRVPGEPLTSVIYRIDKNDQFLLKSAWLVNPQTQKCAVLNVTSIVLLGLLFL